VLLAFSVAPAGGESDSVSAAVAEADEVMAVVKRAVEVVAATAPRVSLVLKADIRPGHTGQMRAKVERVERHLAD